MNNLFDRLNRKYPFLTICQYMDDEYVGIIQNHNKTITTMYDFGMITDVATKELFLELGETWWWESNHNIPINLFLKTDWDPFKPFVRTFTNKTLDILSGPVTSMNNIIYTKRKRKSVVLVRKMT